MTKISGQRKISIRALAAWVATQPARRRYDRMNTRTCLLCQYAEHIGDGPEFHKILARFENKNLDGAIATITLAGGATFGAALKRARKLLPSSRDSGGSP